jgi:hypothetical protein
LPISLSCSRRCRKILGFSLYLLTMAAHDGAISASTTHEFRLPSSAYVMPTPTRATLLSTYYSTSPHTSISSPSIPAANQRSPVNIIRSRVHRKYGHIEFISPNSHSSTPQENYSLTGTQYFDADYFHLKLRATARIHCRRAEFSTRFSWPPRYSGLTLRGFMMHRGNLARVAALFYFICTAKFRLAQVSFAISQIKSSHCHSNKSVTTQAAFNGVAISQPP